GHIHPMKKKVIRGAMYLAVVLSSISTWISDGGLWGYAIWLVFFWLVIVAPVWALANITSAGRLWLPGPDPRVFAAQPPARPADSSHSASEGQTELPAPPPPQRD